ncbi:hypothetical protein GGI25_006253 [Coemansia spiralis]|uniref:Uncharacterized protein n=1 Tax=Coemansia spiralis TaxID=417178 RepID=A0A9W8G1B3_9FUNG|nr:hypothetical protein GGI25_006253 [Coemansia spiralis]
MSGRYGKVLTWQNTQFFAGGTLLTSTICHIWLKPRMERTTELQQRLQRIERNMYWSMSLTQRTDQQLKSALYGYRKHQSNSRLRKIMDKLNVWWNNKLANFSGWAIEPGYVRKYMGSALDSIGRDVTNAWTDTKLSAAGSGAKVVQEAKTAIRWSYTMDRIHILWETEKSKWRHAHRNAIEAVHPLYQQEQPTTAAFEATRTRS